MEAIIRFVIESIWGILKDVGPYIGGLIALVILASIWDHIDGKYFYPKRKKKQDEEAELRCLAAVAPVLHEACLAAAYYIGEAEDPHSRDAVLDKLVGAIYRFEHRKVFGE